MNEEEASTDPCREDASEGSMETLSHHSVPLASTSTSLPSLSLPSTSLSSLIDSLLPPSPLSGCPSHAFSLLLNMRTESSPVDFATSLLHHVLFSQHSGTNQLCRDNRSRLFNAIYTLVSVWIEDIPHDFTDDELVQRIDELFELCAVGEEDRRKTKLLMEKLKETLRRRERYEKALESLVERHEDEMNTCDSLMGLFSISSDSSTVAQQLIHIELERLSMVGLDELMSSVTSSSNESSSSSSSSLHSSLPFNGVSSAVNWFNRLSSLVSTEILRHSRKRQRAFVIETWIETAKECFERGNFNSTCAIVAALNCPPISRLKRTWSRVDTSKLDILQHQLDPSSNFVSYRSTMKAAVWRAEGGKSEEEKIILPFFVLFLKDLYMIYRSCPRHHPNGEINVESFERMTVAVRPMVEWKKRVCVSQRNPLLLQYLLISCVHNDQTLLQRSFQVEEAENSSEKEILRSLRVK